VLMMTTSTTGSVPAPRAQTKWLYKSETVDALSPDDVIYSEDLRFVMKDRSQQRDTRVESHIRPCQQRVSPNNTVQAHVRDVGQQPILIVANAIAVYGQMLDSNSVTYFPCDVPCAYSGSEILMNTSDAALNNYLMGNRVLFGTSQHCPQPASGTPFVMRALLSMERTTFQPGEYDVTVTYKLTSDVPITYFGLWEYNFRRPPTPKTGGAMVAAFISNCNDAARLQVLSDLQVYGVTVHSFGGCAHNAEEDQVSQNLWTNKFATLSRYKFTAAFENSKDEYYITEKLFQPLDLGSVPIYFGDGEHVKDFVPPKSVISVHDFPSIAGLAAFLLRLNASDELYDEYLSWKRRPLPPSLVSLSEFLNQPHSCMLCTRIADKLRREWNQTAVNGQTGQAHEPLTGNDLHIRPRGHFWMRALSLVCGAVQCSMAQLATRVRAMYLLPPDPSVLIDFWDLWTHRRLEHNSDLQPGMEVEFVHLVPGEEGRERRR